jgi:hypothetical protein
MTTTGTTAFVCLWLGCAAASFAADGRVDTTVQEQCDNSQRLCRTECTAAPGTTGAAARSSADVEAAIATMCHEVCEDVRNCSETAVRAK